MKTRGQAKKELEAVPMDVDELSYDILEWFPIGYCEDVFKHLDGKAIKQASGVNKEWRKFCNESKQAAKLKVVFDEYDGLRLNRKSVDMMRRSKRKYQHIEFRDISRRFSKYVPEVLESRAGCWKSVVMSDLPILNKEIWYKILQAIEPTVEEISVNNIYYGLEVDSDFLWTFPCLRRLEGDEFHNEFVGCTSLVKLHWTDCSSQALGVKSKLLLNNHNLEDLAMTTGEITLKNLSDFRFKLKKLSLFKNYRELPAPDLIYTLLETHAQTLESLAMYETFNREILELILNMPKLKSLTTNFEEIVRADPYQGPLPANSTVTTLKLFGFIDQQHPFEVLIRALIGLKHFKCDKIDELVLQILAREAPALESLETGVFRVPRLPEGEIFPNIKEIKCEYFHQDMQEPTGDGNFAMLVRTKMREFEPYQFRF